MTDSPIVTLRGQRSDDWDNLYSLLLNPDVICLTDDLPYISEDAFRDRYTNSAPGLHRLIGEITLPSGRNRFVGLAQIQINMRWRRQHSAELSLIVLPDYYDSEAEASLLAQAVTFAERWLSLRRIYTVIYQDEARALALYEQHGFSCDATMRRYAFRDGTYRDACLMARVSESIAHSTANADSVAVEAEQGAEPAEKSDAGEDDAIIVRGVESGDWEDIAEILQCESVYHNTLQLPYLSRDAVRERYENPSENVRALVAEIDETVVGLLGVHVDPERRTHAAGLGMMVHEEYQGRGVGTALVAAAVELCEQWLNISRIELEVFPDNAAGIALYRKFGFEIEGTLRAYAYRAGQFVDSYLMARVREDES